MKEFDPLALPQASRRFPVYASRGLVASSQNLAAQAGLGILKAGGNAVDAAIATAITLTVVEPTSNGIGGDAFAIVCRDGELYGLNSSGACPAALDASRLRRDGVEAIEAHSWESVTVPGAPASWEALSSRFGSLPFRELFRPAIEYAREGYPVSAVVAAGWKRAFERYRLSEGVHQSWFDTFAPGGRAPSAGETVRLPDHAATLEEIAESGSIAFYKGAIASRTLAYSAASGGYLGAADLARFEPEWVEPLRTAFAGCEICELPPNGQGLVALLALAILGELEDSDLRLRVMREDGTDVHLHVEAIKVSFDICRKSIGDPRYMRKETEADPQGCEDLSGSAADILTPSSVRAAASRIGDRASDPRPAKPDRGGTVYLATADGAGTMVSFIQSNYSGFGSGIVVPGTGIALHNRGTGFTLEEGHPNEMKPGKRPYHTIIPGFLCREGRPLGPFGVMGGFMQPQGHLQVLVRRLVGGENPQAALDAPRWQWISGRSLAVEPEYPQGIARRLAGRGHEISIVRDHGFFGRGQIIERMDSGTYVAGCEGRADSVVATW